MIYRSSIFRAALLIGTLAFTPHKLQAEEFDFGEDIEAESNKSEEGSSLQSNLNKNEHSFFTYGLGFKPIRLKLGLTLAKQIGNPHRWVELGPFAHIVVDLPTRLGRVYSELTHSFNQAFDLEEDSKKVKDQHRSETIIRELYYQYTLGRATFSLGQKIVVFGKADYLPVLDVLTPKDNTKLFFAKPEDARIGQNLLGIDFWQKDTKLSLYFVSNPRMNLNPEPGHPYYLGFEADKTEKAEQNSIVLHSTFTLDDISIELLAGSVYQYEGLIDTNPLTGETQKEYFKETVYGLGATKNMKPYLFKTEIAKFNDRHYQVNEFNELIQASFPTTKKVNTLEWTLGIERQTRDFGLFALETSILKPDETKGEEIKNEQLTALAWSDEFYDQDLNANVQWLTFDRLKNHMIRMAMDLKLTDSLKIECNYTYITIGSDTASYRALEDFDRIGCEASYAL